MQVVLHHDHLRVELDTLARIAGFASTFLVPLSSIREMRATMPEIPGVGEHWLTGFHVPGFVARGRFLSWGGKRRFLWFDSRSQAVLHLRLVGHPDYDEVVLDVPDPEGMIEEMESRRRA